MGCTGQNVLPFLLKIYCQIHTHLGLSDIERTQQFNMIEKEVKKMNQPYIIMGDFNTHNIPLEKSLYTDTCKDNVPTLIGSNKRIDYILVSKDIKILNYNVLPVSFSDHYPVSSEIII